MRHALYPLTLMLFLLACAFPCAAQTVTIGDTAIEAAADNGNGNLLLAQQAVLAQPATLQSLSFYVTTASGKLMLGVYAPNGPNGGPGSMVASTSAFTAVKGWNTQSTLTHPLLQSGTYWLAYFPSSNNLAFRKQNNTGPCWMKPLTFGNLPATFPTTPDSCTPTTWSFYASLTPSGVVAPPVATAAPVVTGNLLVGSQLSTTNGTWSNSPTSYAYQWLDNGAAISGAIAKTYTTQTADVGKMVSSRVTATNAGGAGISTSAAVGPITAPVAAPVNVTPPAVTIAPAAGSTLTASTGTWNNPVTSYAYQWLANNAPIPTATNVNYTMQAADVGKVLNVNVTATGPGGNTQVAAGPMLGWQAGTTPPPPSGPTAFTPLHTYFMSPTGSDANNGLDAAHPWATPNHAVVCGDVIIAATGTYGGSTFGATFQQPTNCPSTTGGIDGSGGIYFAIVLCGGTDIGSTNGCVISGAGNTDGFASMSIDDGISNWAAEGFYFDTGCTNTGSPGNCSRSFGWRNCNGTKAHHLALINSITVNSQQAWGPNDCGNSHGVAIDFVDYDAAVGNLIYNSALNGDYQGGICVGAIDFVSQGNWDTAAGTHGYMYNNYGIKNQSPACATQYDGHFLYMDTPESHLFTQLMVFANNLGYLSTRGCITLTSSGEATPGPTVKIYNNTCFNDVVNANDTQFGDIETNSGNDTSEWVSVTLSNNISQNTVVTNSGGAAPYAVASAGKITTLTVGGTGTENVLKSAQSSCISGGPVDCDPGNNVAYGVYVGPVFPPGSNFYVDPVFTNTTDLLANHVTAPNCTGFTNTTACMGWNANTSVLTTPSVISDLTAGCAQCAGKGFQRPSTTCAANADFPTWLKGIVYLHWTGSAIEQRHDLATTPCGY